MFSAADMLKFANMTTRELKEVLKGNGQTGRTISGGSDCHWERDRQP